MKAYKFDLRISESGLIQLPLNPSLFNREVEIIIVPKSQNETRQPNKAADFVKKWVGFLKNSETDNAKRTYLSEKYQ
jgi:hypothetical protein